MKNKIINRRDIAVCKSGQYNIKYLNAYMYNYYITYIYILCAYT